MGNKNREENKLNRLCISPDTDPVHDEDPVDAESLLQQFGSDGHRVEVTEPPEKEARHVSCFRSAVG